MEKILKLKVLLNIVMDYGHILDIMVKLKYQKKKKF